jgi:hypothetical protein
MGKPRKNPDQIDDTGPEGSEGGSEAPAVQVAKKGDEELPEPRDCPVCGEKAKGPYLDIHGAYRTHCSNPQCTFGDAYARETERESIDMWNVIGPPSVAE